MAARPKNNLSLHLDRYKQQATSTPASRDNKGRTFAFKKLSSSRVSSAPPVPGASLVRPSLTQTLLTSSFSVSSHSSTQPLSNSSSTATVKHATATVQSSFNSFPPSTSSSTVTSTTSVIPRPTYTSTHTTSESNTITTTTTTSSSSSCSSRVMFSSTPFISATQPASMGSSSLFSPTSSHPVTSTTCSTTTISTPTSSSELEKEISEVVQKRMKVMDELCDVFADIPSATLSSLLGNSVCEVKKNLAIRKKLLSREQELRQRQQQCVSPPPRLEFSSPNSPIYIGSQDTPIAEEDSGYQEAEQRRSAGQDYERGNSTVQEYECRNSTGQDYERRNSTGQDYALETEPSYSRTTVQPIFTNHTSATPGQSLSSFHSPFNTQASARQSFPSTQVSTPRTSSLALPDHSHEFSQPAYPHTRELMKIFTKTFGLQHFRPNQLEAINAACLREDCFVLMPTGGGKSLCYQLPALVMSGVTIVVSPLRSLIQDQVQKLCSLGIPACHLSGDMPLVREREIYAELTAIDSSIKLLYVTPEKLGASSKLQQTLHGLHRRGSLSRFIIDEAHCISQWGHDFRPDYKRLSELREKYPGTPLMALTATATPKVQTDILHQLRMKTTKWFTQSFNRTNLHYSVLPKKPRKVTQDIVDLIKSQFRGQSGIVYCLSRRDCELVSQDLSQAGIPALCYHAGLSDSERTSTQERWVREDMCKVVCATIAFGMGIDKPDVRFVIHHSLAKSIEGYYQEAGRAGRDSQPAQCILFYSYADMYRIRRLIKMEGTYVQQQRHLDNLYRMVQYCENESDCRRAQLLGYFAEQFDPAVCKSSSTSCDNCHSKVPFRTEDVTDLVKVILTSLRMGVAGQVTLVQLMDALRGSQSSKGQLLNLPLFGKGNSLTKHDLERLLHMMVLKNVLAEDLQIGNHDNVVSYVKLGPKSDEVFQGRYGKVLLQLRGKGGANSNARNSSATSAKDNLKEECYQALNCLRLSIAGELKRNPEAVMSVATLREMSVRLPTTQGEMMGVIGMTEVRWKNYRGEEFLKLTSDFAARSASLPTSPTTSPYFEQSTSSSKENRRPQKRKSKGRSQPSAKKNPVVVTPSDDFEQPTRLPRLLPPPQAH